MSWIERDARMKHDVGGSLESIEKLGNRKSMEKQV